MTGQECKHNGFNSRTRVGCDTQYNHYRIIRIKFQFTHPRGVRRLVVGIGCEGGLVSIHAPAWGATYSMVRKYFCNLVSIHAPAWGATDFTDLVEEERRVSIHAPAWGATKGLCEYLFRGGVSIHAPAWGATKYLRKISQILCSFNSRTRVGCDLRTVLFSGHDYRVSIHAPAWGATKSLTG